MIDISYATHPQLYNDYRECLKFLANVKAEDHPWPDHVVKFHHYSEVTNKKQLLAIESYFATQDQEHTRLVLWSDWDVKDNPLLAPYRSKIDFRVFDPIALAVGTLLQNKADLLLADDTKHYMRSGLLRFLALYKEGGIWYDMDMVLLRDLRPILDQEFAYVWAQEHHDFTKFGPCAAFMGMRAGSEHAKVCLQELGNAPAIPNSVSRDCDMLRKVYARRPFTVFPAAFFNVEWQMPGKEEDRLRTGWFKRTKESDDLCLESFAWHWHGSGGTRAHERVEPGSKFDQIQKHITAQLPASISFIFVTRNDGYNNDLGVYPVPGVKDVHLERIAATLRALHYLDIPGQEIILVECFPVEGRPTCKDLFSDYARVITIPTEVRERLYKQVPYRLPIYEFLGKHTGAMVARSNRFFFHNSDDIFRRSGIQEAMRIIDAGKLARADRVGVHPVVVTDQAGLRNLVDDTSPKGIPGINRFFGAGGDYMGIRRDLYFKVGGWRVAHGEWDLDIEFIRRCEAAGITKVQEDTFYHLEHYTPEVSQHRDTPNRPPRIPGEQHPLIADLDEIIAGILRYNNIHA